MRTVSSLRAAVAVIALAALGSAQCSIATLLAANNQGNAGGGFYFDLTINYPSGLTIVALDANFSSTAGTTGTLDVYTTPTTYVGSLTTPSVWTLVGSAPVTAAGRNVLTRANYSTPIVLPQGTMGVALHANGVAHAYTNGTGSNQTYSNGGLTLQFGSAQNTLFNGGIFTPRVWNGVIYYQGSCASAVPYGTGCGATPQPTFYELFDASNPNDLSGSGIALNWAGQFYVVTQGATQIVPPSSQPATFTDNSTQRVSLPWSFPTQLGGTNDIWVCSNGWVALEPTTSTDMTESVSELLNGPIRFCPFWDDLDPGTTGGGTIHVEQDPGNPGAFHVTWTGVPEYPNSGANDFQLSLYQNGTAEFKWGTMSAVDGLVGYSPGNGSLDPGATDLSAMGALILGTGRPDLDLVPVSRPVLGTTVTTRTENIPSTANAGFLVYGFLRFDPGIALPLLGPGCFQHVSVDASTFFLPTASAVTHSAMIPNNPSLAGTALNLQSAILDQAPGTILTSNGVAWIAEAQ